MTTDLLQSPKMSRRTGLLVCIVMIIALATCPAPACCAEPQAWDIAVRFDNADHNDFYPFGSEPGVVGTTYRFSMTDPAADGRHERYIPWCYTGSGWKDSSFAVSARQKDCGFLNGSCADADPATTGCTCYEGVVSVARVDGWYVEKIPLGDGRYRLIVNGVSKADCTYGKSYVSGEVTLNPQGPWRITGTGSCRADADERPPFHETYCTVTATSVRFASGDNTCGGCCACEDSGNLNINVTVEKIPGAVLTPVTMQVTPAPDPFTDWSALSRYVDEWANATFGWRSD